MKIHEITNGKYIRIVQDPVARSIKTLLLVLPPMLLGNNMLAVNNKNRAICPTWYGVVERKVEERVQNEYRVC